MWILTKTDIKSTLFRISPPLASDNIDGQRWKSWKAISVHNTHLLFKGNLNFRRVLFAFSASSSGKNEYSSEILGLCMHDCKGKGVPFGLLRSVGWSMSALPPLKRKIDVAEHFFNMFHTLDLSACEISAYKLHVRVFSTYANEEGRREVKKMKALLTWERKRDRNNDNNSNRWREFSPTCGRLETLTLDRGQFSSSEAKKIFRPNVIDIQEFFEREKKRVE